MILRALLLTLDQYSSWRARRVVPMIRSAVCGQISPEVHDHLHSFECVKLQIVKTAPDSQLLNLLPVS